MLRLSLPTRTLCDFKALLNGCSQIFLQQHPLCGLLCLLAIGLTAPQLLGGALLGGFAGALTARQQHYAADDIEAGLYSYNGVLLGLLLCHSFAWSPLLALVIVGSAGLSSLILGHWLRLARKYDGLPAYTSPFVGLGWLLISVGGVLNPEVNPAAPTPLHGLLALDLPLAVLRGLSQVIFLSDPLAGLCIFAALLLANRRAALWALLGSALALALALQQAQQSAALGGLFGLNGALVAIVLGQRYRRPWPALVGILLSVLLQPGFTALGLATPLTAPFILACWLVPACIQLWRNPATDCAPHERKPRD